MVLPSTNRKWGRTFPTLVMVILLLSCCMEFRGVAEANRLHLQANVEARHHSAALALDSLTLTNVFQQSFSVTRLDLLLSDFSLHKTAGGWIQQPNSETFISMGESRTHFAIALPAGEYDRIRFKIGLSPEVNHSNPAQYPADHPLNPNLNGLHWNWAGGYVFFAIEGHWMTRDGRRSGYSFHLGNDWMLTPIELSLPKIINETTDLQITLDLGELFDFEFSEENSSTHSREGDAFAFLLQNNLRKAFHITRKQEKQTIDFTPAGKSSVGSSSTPFTQTPYPFAFPAQFPIPDLPRDNPLTEEGIALGQLLFFDNRLSANNSQSCATCHEPAKAFTDAPRRFSLGATSAEGTRNSMPLFNLAWKKSFFWDGRTPTLRQQVLEPIENPIEMHESLENVISKLTRTPHEAGAPDYPSLFQSAFGSSEITAGQVAKALEQFLLTKLSFDSKFDRALEGKAELTIEEKRGFELFVTEFDPRRGQFGADCFHCHGGPFFTSHGFANNGLDSEFLDPGRYSATKNERDRGKFAVPSLRNVELTAPYMHDGRFATLEEVIEHYSTGVKGSTTLDPNLAKHPVGGVPLSEADKKALVSFLKTLTDSLYLE